MFRGTYLEQHFVFEPTETLIMCILHRPRARPSDRSRARITRGEEKGNDFNTILNRLCNVRVRKPNCAFQFHRKPIS